MDGLAHRLVPAENTTVPVAGEAPFVNTDWAFGKMMNTFASGNADLPGVYFDEENKRHLNSIRDAYSDLAFDLINKGRKEDAKTALRKADKMILEENFAYGQVSRGNYYNRTSLRFLSACYAADEKELAAKVLKGLKKDLEQQQDYYVSLGKGSEKLNRAEYDKLMKEYVFRYNSARTRQDQVNADVMLESRLTGSHQTNMTNDIRMSYSMLMELEQMVQLNNPSKVASPETTIKDSPMITPR
jgi:hypothetical protein